MAFSSHRLSERASQLQNPGSRKRCENCTILPRQCGKEVISACHPKNRVQLKGRKKKYNTHGGKEKSANRVSGPQKKKTKPPKTIRNDVFRGDSPVCLFSLPQRTAKASFCGKPGLRGEKEEVWRWRLHLSS